MPRIPLVEPENASAEVRALYDSLQSQGMPLLNVMKIFANHADFLAAMVHFSRPLYGNPHLAPRYRELAYLRSSQLNSCHY